MSVFFEQRITLFSNVYGKWSIDDFPFAGWFLRFGQGWYDLREVDLRIFDYGDFDLYLFLPFWAHEVAWSKKIHLWLFFEMKPTL